MRRYSIAPSSSHRKSTINPNVSKLDDNLDGESATLELERLEQGITLVLQEIDKNLSKSNAVINDKIFPILKKYATSSSNVWNNVNFWKYFLEQAANVELTSYEAPANLNTDLNTIANSKNNFLLLDEEEEEGQNKPNESEAQNEEKVKQFKKPASKSFNNEELTPIWTAGERAPPQNQYNMEASTPQLKQRASFMGEPKTTAKRTDDNYLSQTAPTLAPSFSSDEQTSSTRSPSKRASPSMVTHTIRQSLDNYHKISISPRKAQRSQQRTPLRERDTSDGVRRRSSMIQNLLDSSPTLPEPPVLLSERGYMNSSGNSKDENEIKESSQSKNLDRLSPILLPPKSTPGRTNDRGRSSNDNTLQRFPRTPNYSSSAGNDKEVDIMRTPLGVRIRYGDDDSDLPPPELQNSPIITSENNRHSNNHNVTLDVDEDDVPLPDLETIQLPNSNKKKRPSSTTSSTKKQKPLAEDDDELNVFLDSTSNKNNISAAGTIYHSLINNQDTSQNQSKDNTANHSKENSLNQSNSRSISYLFEEVLYNANVQGKADSNKNQPNLQAKDLFGSFSEQANDQNQLPEHDNANNTENSTSELGSLLGERFKNFTNYSQNFGN